MRTPAEFIFTVVFYFLFCRRVLVFIFYIIQIKKKTNQIFESNFQFMLRRIIQRVFFSR